MDKASLATWRFLVAWFARVNDMISVFFTDSLFRQIVIDDSDSNLLIVNHNYLKSATMTYMYVNLEGA